MKFATPSLVTLAPIVSFRVGADADADVLSKKFQPIFDREDVLRLPNYNTVTQMLIGGVPTQPFSMATIPPLGTPNDELGSGPTPIICR